MATAPNTEKCASCNNPEPPAEPNYILLESEQTCAGYRRFTCENGTPAGGRDLVQSTEKCDRCDDGYRLTDSSRQMTCATRTETCFVCSINLYRCDNGTRVESTDGNRPNVHEGETKCKSCDDNYALVPVDSMVPHGAKRCLLDADADGVPNEDDLCPNGQTGWTRAADPEQDEDGDGCRDMDEDVDDDNDGLIDIYDLNALHNIRHNPAGTSYKTSADDAGLTSGAATSLTDTECSSLTTGGVALCGYELMNDLDFAEDESYADTTVKRTWCPGANTCNSTNTGHAGFPGLGENFNAVFHGNGHSDSPSLYAEKWQCGTFPEHNQRCHHKADRHRRRPCLWQSEVETVAFRWVPWWDTMRAG